MNLIRAIFRRRPKPTVAVVKPERTVAEDRERSPLDRRAVFTFNNPRGKF